MHLHTNKVLNAEKKQNAFFLTAITEFTKKALWACLLFTFGRVMTSRCIYSLRYSSLVANVVFSVLFQLNMCIWRIEAVLSLSAQRLFSKKSNFKYCSFVETVCS